MIISRRSFSRNLTLTICGSSIAIKSLAGQAARSADLVWYDVESWGVEGKGWQDTKRYYDRLPGKAEELVRQAVWDLSRHSAGMSVRFATDSKEIQVRYQLYSENLAMPHMPATGVSGVDLYAEDELGVERWVSVARPEEQSVEAELAKDLAPGERTYRLYLPLYNGVDKLEIGINAGASWTPIAPRQEKPIVFYGTSIMHGACASRPGMSISSILSRRLKKPVINLGFSGNGRMEQEVGALLTELDPCLYAIDCLPNMNEQTVSERAAPLVRQLRLARQATPILLVEDRSFTNSAFFPRLQERHRTSRLALNESYQELLADGIDNLYYLAGDKLLGFDGEGATDGSHPNDLGMVRYADAYEPAIRSILGKF
ncbi:MAG: SGNH/GDSL hydrolase family protein [Saprospiraceae bacterium]|nr:SGNH/GDSL hydrolase family protein [Saprospiraceae bacterium]